MKTNNNPAAQPPAAAPGFTPGEWKAERIGADYQGSKETGMAYRIIAPNAGHPADREIAILYYKPDFRDSEANARLIAAAPCLYRALEVISAMATPVSTLPWEKTLPIDFAKTMDAIAVQARAALAKATGQ